MAQPGNKAKARPSHLVTGKADVNVYGLVSANKGCTLQNNQTLNWDTATVFSGCLLLKKLVLSHLRPLTYSVVGGLVLDSCTSTHICTHTHTINEKRTNFL